MKKTLAALALLLTTHQAAAFEPESADALAQQCARYPGTRAAFCDCLSQSAVAELPVRTRHDLWIQWMPQSIFRFDAPMTPNDLPEVHEKEWGWWQRKAVNACGKVR